MTEGEKKTNKITGREFSMIAILISFLGIGLLFALFMPRPAQGGEIALESGVIVHRGGEPSGKATLALEYHAGVTVVRGNSNYPVYEIRESSNPEPAVDPARQWFDSFDAWRARTTYRRLHPRP